MRRMVACEKRSLVRSVGGWKSPATVASTEESDRVRVSVKVEEAEEQGFYGDL